jgi:hypothetical protein
MPCGDGIGRGSVGGDLAAGLMDQFGRRSSVFVAFAILAGVVGFSARSQELPKAPEIKAEQKPEGGLKSEPSAESNKQSPTPSLAPVPEVLSGGQNGKCTGHCDDAEKEGTEFWPPLWGYRLKITDTLVAAFTALLFFATLALWWSTRRLVRGAQETAQRQLRAYVFVESASITHVDNNEGVPEVVVTVRNFGQTPAYKLANLTCLALCPHPAPPHITAAMEQDMLADITASTDMGPGHFQQAPVSTNLGRPFTEEEMQGLASGKYVIYVYGRVRYVDAFGNKQLTKYRFMTGGEAGVRGGQLAGCEEGNEAT